MFWEWPVDSALSKLKQNVNAPIRVVFWDGREVAFSDEPRVTLRLNGTRAAAKLSNPSLLSLAEAYIDGDAELEGDVREAIRGAVEIARAMPVDLQVGVNERATPARRSRAIQHHYDVSTSSTSSGSTAHGVPCAYFRKEGDTSRPRSCSTTFAGCACIPASAFSTSAAGGAPGDPGRVEIRRRRDGHHASENQFQLPTNAPRRLEPLPRVVGTTGMRPAKGSTTRSRAWGCSSTGLRNLLVLGAAPAAEGERASSITVSPPWTRATAPWALARGIIDRFVPARRLPHLHRAVRDMADQDLEVHDVEACVRTTRTLGCWSDSLSPGWTRPWRSRASAPAHLARHLRRPRLRAGLDLDLRSRLR